MTGGPNDMTDPMDGIPAAEALAMEWALGALDAPARAAAEERRRSDPQFAALCAMWAERLAPLAEDIPPAAPSADLWNRIDAAIGADSIVAQPVRPQPERATSWWNQLLLWRGATAGFAALALALLLNRPDAALPLQPQSPPDSQPEVPPQPAPALLAATLQSEGGQPLVTAALDASRGSVLIAPVDGPDLEGRVPELWLIPADGKPRSLGVIDLGGTRAVVIPPTLLTLVTDGAVLAVSLEPVGGSPTGAPTGPVVATGKLAAI